VHTVKVYGGVELCSMHSESQHWMKVIGQHHALSTLAPRKSPHNSHWICSWVGHRDF